MKTLIIVDIQNDFVTGSLATDPKETFVEQTATWLAEHVAEYDHVVVTQDWHETDATEHIQEWGAHCMANTPGAALHPAIAKALENVSFERFLKGQRDHGYSGFEGVSAVDGTPFADHLAEQGTTTVDIIGIATEHCVRATAFDAIDAGYTVQVLRDQVNAVDATAGNALLNGGFQTRGVKVV